MTLDRKTIERCAEIADQRAANSDVYIREAANDVQRAYSKGCKQDAEIIALAIRALLSEAEGANEIPGAGYAPLEGAVVMTDTLITGSGGGPANSHKWITSTHGHGETMCAHCGITNREAAVLGETDQQCPNAPAPGASTPAPAVAEEVVSELERVSEEDVPPLDDGLLAKRARQTAEIALRERSLGYYVAPYAGALLLEFARRLEANLLASPAQDAADAARYRYLRDNCSYHHPMEHAEPSPAEWGIEWQFQQSKPGEQFLTIDQLVDADMLAAPTAQDQS